MVHGDRAAAGAVAQAAHEERARGGSEAAGPDTRIRLLLWRHGQTAWNVEGRFQGQTDIPLDETGEQQAERAARLLAALRPDVIISSDLSRAMATAAPLARLTGLTVSTDKDLRERHGGAWEGLTDVQIRTQYPVEHAQWLPPGGESTATVGERAGAALHRIADGLAPGSLAVVVSHGAALRLGAARLLGPARGSVGHHRAAGQLLLVSSGPAQLPVAAHRAQRRHVAGAGAQRRPLTVAAGVGQGGGPVTVASGLGWRRRAPWLSWAR